MMSVEAADGTFELEDGVVMRRRGVLRRLTRSKVTAVALGVVVVVVLVAFFAGLLAPEDPNQQSLSRRFEGPGTDFWFGSDDFGRDNLSRLISATRVSMLAAAQGVGIAVVLGLPLGLVAGYAGRIVDAVLGRVADGFMGLPPLIFAMAILGMLGPGLTNAMVAVGIILAPRYFRLARAAAQSVGREAYIEACRADGCSPKRLLWRHVLPNSSGPLLVETTVAVGFVIGAEAALSFLGLGVQAPQSSWGGMIRGAFRYIETEPYQMLPPTLAVVITITGFFLLGDGLRDLAGRQSQAD